MKNNQKTVEVVINNIHDLDGLSLTNEHVRLLRGKGIKVIKENLNHKTYPELNRWDPILVETTKILLSNWDHFKSKFPLEIVEVPVGKKFFIDDYDGKERVVFHDDIEWTTFN